MKEFEKTMAWALLLAGEIKDSGGTTLGCGSTKKIEATMGWSVVWQQDIEQTIMLLISWPQFM